MARLALLSCAFIGTSLASYYPAPLASIPGHKDAIPSWDFQTTSDVSKDIASLSQPGVDTSKWHHAPVSRCTLMGCLLAAGDYKDDELWYSDNLNKFNWGQFSVPWVYRNEFQLSPQKDCHFFLQTNGIIPYAELYLNGKKVANSVTQSGAYGGHEYDITNLVAKDNALVVKVFPTDYQYDFAVGFVDWNPYPPDNGTGVWRDITVKQTGPVSMGAMSIGVAINTPIESNPATVTIKTKAQNLENKTVKVKAYASIFDPSGKETKLSKDVELKPHQSQIVQFSQTINKPEIWWPAALGGQPLYSAEVSYSVDGHTSDASQSNFGIRTVTSTVNKHNDTAFTVNGHPYQLMGSGYGADMFLRWDNERFENIANYVLDMGMNTIRLEGKMEQPELYEIADRLGLFVLPGWECCDRWEDWAYNDELFEFPPPPWHNPDYVTANASILHEAEVLQTHPSIIGFLVGSDYWPNDRASKIYVDGLKGAGWQTPIIASAAKRGYPEILGPSGMKMDGPYDWVPPAYWYDTEPTSDRAGASFGFGSELGAGVGTPELSSLVKFLTTKDMEDLWKKPNMGLFHMSTNVSQFYDRKIYNDGLWGRFGAATSLDDYLIKAQMMDYEATKSQYEGYSSKWNADRPATGLIYWMLNNAWPSLHWNQFDYYLHPAGSYFGTKVGTRMEHVAYDYFKKSISLINHSLDKSGSRTIKVDLVDLKGKSLASTTITHSTQPNQAISVGALPGFSKIKDVGILRLVLSDQHGKTLSRNAYWISSKDDVLDWKKTTWYYTKAKSFGDFTALNKMDKAKVTAHATKSGNSESWSIQLENTGSVPAVFIRANLVDSKGKDVVPVNWSDNYVTLLPKEKVTLEVAGHSGAAVHIDGKNVAKSVVQL